MQRRSVMVRLGLPPLVRSDTTYRELGCDLCGSHAEVAVVEEYGEVFGRACKQCATGAMFTELLRAFDTIRKSRKGE